MKYYINNVIIYVYKVTIAVIPESNKVMLYHHLRWNEYVTYITKKIRQLKQTFLTLKNVLDRNNIMFALVEEVNSRLY